MPEYRLSFTGEGKCILEEEGSAATCEFDEIAAVIAFIQILDVNHDSTLAIYDKFGNVRFQNLLSQR